MKIIIILLALFLTSVIYSQVDTSFNGLRGYEDLDGNTHLFYRNVSHYLVKRSFENYKGEHRNDIFHYSVANKIDSLFILDVVEIYTPFTATGHTVSDFEFVDNTLTDFYQCGDALTSFEPNPVLVYNREYDNYYGVNSFMSQTFNLEITKVDSIINVYVQASGDDKGIHTYSLNGTFDLIETTRNYSLVSVNRNQPNIMFVENNDGYLFKSVDTGATFYLVDSTCIRNYHIYNYINKYFLYDSDSLHIYRVVSKENRHQFFVSNNKGEFNSWEKVIEADNEIFISYDSTKSGLLYLATGKDIYESHNYGETFQLFKQFNRNIEGLYKKPNSDLIYATTSHSLLEINSDSIKILTQLIDYANLSYYPLHIGDKWYYNVTGNHYDVEQHPFDIDIKWTVSKDTIMNNGLKYYEIIEKRSDNNNLNYRYERIDSTALQIYTYASNIENINNDLLIYDFSKEVGDTIFSNVEDINNSFSSVYLKDTLMQIFDSNEFITIPTSRVYSWWSIVSDNRTLSPNFGLTRRSSEADGYDDNWVLKAALINGIKYGDSTLVNVATHSTNAPSEFSLSQNYPNPFNPSTTIKYSIPSVQTPLLGGVRGGFVTLKIYDILGREIETLVNKEQNAGNYEVQFDASNLTSGIYLYRLHASTGSATEFVESKKMMLIK